jgi:hypothetical protein
MKSNARRKPLFSERGERNDSGPLDQEGCMRHWQALIAVVAVAACADEPSTGPARFAPSLSLGSERAPPVVLNTQMRWELEFPVPAIFSESKGHAQIKVLADGTVESKVLINNKSEESVLFGHIHHLNPGAQTGPVIWWLTSPVGAALNLTERHLEFRQRGIFVSGPPPIQQHFATEAAALAALLANPASFYVNFHSAALPAGFARGFLQ